MDGPAPSGAGVSHPDVPSVPVDEVVGGSAVPAEGETHTGELLDQDHAPETNGRMAVCRRCGSRTDGPQGARHLPSDRQLTRIQEWLVAESQRVHIERARAARRSGG